MAHCPPLHVVLGCLIGHCVKVHRAIALISVAIVDDLLHKVHNLRNVLRRRGFRWCSGCELAAVVVTTLLSYAHTLCTSLTRVMTSGGATPSAAMSFINSVSK